MEEILASIRKIITDENDPAAGAGANDVVELTQMVQDDGSVVDVSPPEPEPAPPQPEAVMTPEKPDSETLISDSTSSAAASSLSSLVNTVEIERLATAPLMATPLGNGARSLEDMVIELMRPLLKQWLEQNLPATVDRLVQKEIERIARKAQD